MVAGLRGGRAPGARARKRCAALTRTWSSPRSRRSASTAPWSGRPATDLTLQAWSGGVIGLARGNPDHPPIAVGGQIGEWLSGAFAAIGTLAAAPARPTTAGELVDVSMLEAMATVPHLLPGVVPRPARPAHAQAPLRAHAWRGGGQGRARRPRLRHRPAVARLLRDGGPPGVAGGSVAVPRRAPPRARRSTRGSPSARWTRCSTRHRRSASPTHRSSTAPTPRPSATSKRGARSWPTRATERPTRGHRSGSRRPASGRRRRPRASGSTPSTRSCRRRVRERARAGGTLPFSGLRVLDMTAYWAGPFVGHLLALLGAEVIHLESAARPDGVRLVGGRAADRRSLLGARADLQRAQRRQEEPHASTSPTRGGSTWCAGSSPPATWWWRTTPRGCSTRSGLGYDARPRSCARPPDGAHAGVRARRTLARPGRPSPS